MLSIRLRPEAIDNIAFRQASFEQVRAPLNDSQIVISDFEVDFISDTCNRKINKIMNNDFKIKLISKPGKQLNQCLNKTPPTKKNEIYDVCSNLPDNVDVMIAFLDYKLTCKHCGQFYKSKSCHLFRLRLLEHKRSIDSNKKSALWQNMRTMITLITI